MRCLLTQQGLVKLKYSSSLQLFISAEVVAWDSDILFSIPLRCVKLKTKWAACFHIRPHAGAHTYMSNHTGFRAWTHFHTPVLKRSVFASAWATPTWNRVFGSHVAWHSMALRRLRHPHPHTLDTLLLLWHDANNERSFMKDLQSNFGGLAKNRVKTVVRWKRGYQRESLSVWSISLYSVKGFCILLLNRDNYRFSPSSRIIQLLCNNVDEKETPDWSWTLAKVQRALAVRASVGPGGPSQQRRGSRWRWTLCTD